MDTMDGELDRPLVEQKRQNVIKEGFMKYLVAYEFLERVALRGVQTILAIYLLESLHFNEAVATELVHFFLIGSFISPIVGSFLSDGFTGNYTACYLFSYCELLGHILLTTSAIPVASWQRSRFNHGLIPFALLMVVLGSGALKPCQVTFGGDQMNHYVQHNKYQRSNSSGGKRRSTSHEFFSAYYMAMNLGTLFSALVSPILRVRGHGNYFYAFLMPACSMALCILSFWLGRGHYYYRPAPKIVVDSLTRPALAGRGTSTENAEESKTEKHTAADEASNLQDFKDTLYVLSVIIPCPFFTAMFFQTSSTWVFQARIMDCHVSWLGGFTIQPDQMPALNPILVVLIIPLLDNFVYSFVEKYIVLLPNLKRMVLALVAASLAFVASGFLQMVIESDLQEKQAQGLHSIAQTDISVLWQIPQYFLISLAETLMFIPAIDWAYKEAPESMKTVVQAALHVSSAIGNIITIAVVAIIGTRGSKVTESFVFAALGAFATGLMTVFSYTYITKEKRAARRQESQPQ